MSRSKHYSLDDAEVLETKVDQLEKRLENIERFVFSQPKQNDSSSSSSSSAQLVQVITALLAERQNSIEKKEEKVKEKDANELQPRTNVQKDAQKANIDNPSPLHIDRLRTVV